MKCGTTGLKLWAAAVGSVMFLTFGCALLYAIGEAVEHFTP